MSRHDNIGLLWEDKDRERSHGVATGQNMRPLPPIPDTGWTPPTAFPRLDQADLIAIDVETYDPGLRKGGSGVRRDAHIVGLAVGTRDARWYFPMRHEVQKEMNLDPDAVMRWARDNLCNPSQPKIGAKILYDLDFLHHAGVPVVGQMIDVQVAEPLLDENAWSYSLDSISKKHLGEGKVDDDLYLWSSVAYGGEPTRKQIENIYRCPPCLAGPYAEFDVDAPIRIFDKQRPLLEADGLLPLFSIESRLIPMLLAMRQRGVRVDIAAAERAYDLLTTRIEQAEKSIGKLNVYAPQDIERYCKRNNVPYLLTAAGNASFTAEWLERSTDPVLRQITQIRKWYKARDTFIKGYILNSHVNGRIHAQFNQLPSEEGGAVSGRFSSSNPNLQNIPTRDEEIGPMMRRMFIPEEGEGWARLDWSQIEFRFLTHYGRGTGAEVARDMYRQDPNTDFHKMVAELVWPGQPEMRKPAKTINFGLVYGMGEPLLASNLGRSLAEVKPIFETYHRNLPFIKYTYEAASSAAAQRGYIVTALGRRRRFTEWEMAKWGDRKEYKTWPSMELAQKEHPGKIFRRAFTHKSLNAIMQGSAADLMKKAMVDVWEAGYCAPGELGAPLLIVHDEKDLSYKPDKFHLVKEVQRIMETCMELKVPIRADLEIGPNWGELQGV